jgi:SAM-dependent methyltransferase
MIAVLAAAAALALPSAAASSEVGRPVAGIVSPIWSSPERRDQAHEIDQIVARLNLRSGSTVADIGAGSGYDTLRLAKVVGPRGHILAEDVTPDYLAQLRAEIAAAGLKNVTVILGSSGDPKLPPRSIDAAIMVHMYHEIERPYDLLWRLATAFKAGGRLGIEEGDRPTAQHGTPPALLTCELAAVGYRRLSLAPLQGGLGYFAVFAPPATRPDPRAIKPCPG